MQVFKALLFSFILISVAGVNAVSSVFLKDIKDSQALVLSKGVSYQGQVKNKVPHGKGILTDESGIYYEGDWIKGKFDGIGLYIWADGVRYQGQLKNGNAHGKGVKTLSDGSRYEGVWVNGRPLKTLK